MLSFFVETTEDEMSVHSDLCIPAGTSAATSKLSLKDGSFTDSRLLLPPTPSLSGRETLLDTRLTQSWHSGQRRQEVIPPVMYSRSFDGTVRSEDWNRNSTRTFGGIERIPRPTLPTAEQQEAFSSFCQYYSTHHRKPHVVAFVNAKSGGQTGAMIMRTLRASIGEDVSLPCTGEVCDLSLEEEPQRTIEQLAQNLEKNRPKRLLVCGGDGTVTWILTALEQCALLREKLHLLPVAIVPLGTGNDLARSLGWGKKLRVVGDVLEYLRLVIEATPVQLDQWRVILRPHANLATDHKLTEPGSHPQRVDDEGLATQLKMDIQQALGVRALSPAGTEVYVGFWQNYYSIGLDAKIAWSVDASRSSSHCGRLCFRRGCGKLCYAWQGLRRACGNRLLTHSIDLLRHSNADATTEEFLDLDPPLQDVRVDCSNGRARQLMMVNINTYGGGLDVLPKPDQCVAPPSPSDGLLEVLAVRNAVFSATHFLRCRRPSYITSSQALAFRLNSSQYMQLDGEPWYIEGGCDVLVEPHRKLTMLRAPEQGRFWRGHVGPSFWQGTSPLSRWNDVGHPPQQPHM